jgi:hypothetical protein
LSSKRSKRRKERKYEYGRLIASGQEYERQKENCIGWVTIIENKSG